MWNDAPYSGLVSFPVHYTMSQCTSEFNSCHSRTNALTLAQVALRKDPFVMCAHTRHAMVAEPGPTTSEKWQTLLNKEQINDDEERKAQATLNGELKSLEKIDCVRLMKQECCGHSSKFEIRLIEGEGDRTTARQGRRGSVP